MRTEVIVRLPGAPDQTLVATAPMALDAARAWLDAEYVRLECVPHRASGKVLSADKLLSVADAAGPVAFADAAWAASYAAAAAGVLGKALITVDLGTSTVGY